MNISIHNFSKLSGVESSTLRYWDEMGVFSPLERNPVTNYRYYSAAQLHTLNCVTVLSELEVPLKTIAELKEERNPDSLLKVLEKQEKQMDLEMRNLHQRYSIIHARRELINKGMKANENSVFVMRREEKAITIWPENEYDDGDSFIEPLAAIVATAAEHRLNLSFPVGGFFKNAESFFEAPGRPHHFFSIDPLGKQTLKKGDYLIGYSRGYYGRVNDLPERMKAYANENSLTFAGPVYIEYLIDELCTPNPDQYLAQCSISVVKSKK